MSSFDFSALLRIFTSFFEALMNLFAKLGFDPAKDAEGDDAAKA